MSGAVRGKKFGDKRFKHDKIFDEAPKTTPTGGLTQREFRERSERDAEFAKTSVERAQTLLAHFPAGDGWFLLVKDMMGRKDRKGRPSPEMCFAKKELILSYTGSIERLIFQDPDSENAKRKGIKFYPTDSPEVLHLVEQELERSPYTDFYNEELTGQNQRKFLRFSPARLAFLEKAEETGHDVGDLEYLRQAITKEEQ